MRKVLLLIFISAITIHLFAQEEKIITINDDIQIEQLQDSIYRHITWEKSEQFGRFPSNGMIIIKNGEAIMIDTPFDNEKTKLIYEYLKDSMGVKIIKQISGHYHLDCVGGLEYLNGIGIESIANYMTIEKCKELGVAIPVTSFKDELIVDLNGLKLVCKYFGGGHTPDNIVVWIPKYKILFGGCLIKSEFASNLGFTGDADMENYDLTIEKILNEYPEISMVIPGHGNVGGKILLTHTIELVKNQKDHENEN